MTAEKSGDTPDDTPDGYNTDQTRATRLKPDTEAAYLRYRDEHEISDAEALRRLVRQALDSEVRDKIQLATAAAGLAYVAAFLGAGPTAGAAVGGSYIAAILIWTSWPSGP